MGRWTAALQAGGRPVPGPVGAGPLLALALLVVGLLAAFGVWLRKDAVLGLSATLGARELRARSTLAALIARRLISLPAEAVRVLEERVFPGLESSLGRALLVTGGLVDRRPPLVPTLLGLALVLALVFGLLGREVTW